jgi:ABC-2 type transport system permease protein
MSTIAPTRPTPPGGPATGRPRRATFAQAVRSEWIKLFSLRSSWITLAVAVLLGVGLGTLISYLAGDHYNTSGPGNQSSWDPTAVSFTGIFIAQLAIAVLGVLVITSEYSSGMIRVSLAAVPRRSRFWASKALVFTTVALVVGEVMAFAAFLLGQLVIGNNAPHASLGSHDVLRAVIGAGLYLAAVGLLAMAIGTLLRNTAAGISAIVALLFVLPGVAQALPDSWRNPVTKFWPTQAGDQIFVLHRDAHTLSAWLGLGWLVLFTAIVALAANYLLNRRDA